MPRKHGAYPSVREAILDVAENLFLQGGVNGVSLQDIATVANLSKGTLYYYYPTKESLVMELAHNNIEHITDMLFSWVDSLSRGDNARSALLSLVNDLTENGMMGGFFMVLCSAAAMGDSSLRELLSSAFKEWVVMFEVGVLKLQSKNAAALRNRSNMFFTMLLGFVFERQGGISDPDREALVDLFIR